MICIVLKLVVYVHTLLLYMIVRLQFSINYCAIGTKVKITSTTAMCFGERRTSNECAVLFGVCDVLVLARYSNCCCCNMQVSTVK